MDNSMLLRRAAAQLARLALVAFTLLAMSTLLYGTPITGAMLWGLLLIGAGGVTLAGGYPHRRQRANLLSGFVLILCGLLLLMDFGWLAALALVAGGSGLVWLALRAL